MFDSPVPVILSFMIELPGGRSSLMNAQSGIKNIADENISIL